MAILTPAAKPASVVTFRRRGVRLVALLFCFVLVGCKQLGGGGGGGGKNLTSPVTGLTATSGNAEVTLTWTPYPGADSYDVKRSNTSGGPYSYLNQNFLIPTTSASYTDAGLTNGTTYYYLVVANGSWGVSNPSNQVFAAPSGPSNSIALTVDFLSNPHRISPYIYGGAFPEKLATAVNAISTAINYDILTVRWGGNASSTYNWQLGTYNAGSVNFFEDFTFCGVGGPATSSPCKDSDSVQFIKDVESIGTSPVMTMPMLSWVAQSPESNGNGHWSFSVARDGPQCHTDPQNSDAGDGIVRASNCDTQPAYLTASSGDINDTYVPLLDDHSQT